jgi:MoxR-like ATPase
MDDAGKLARSGQKQMEGALAAVNRVILGKDHEIRLALACLLARGHLLIEDIPGVGKTTLAHALARVLGLSYQRVQFTSDLLPADIIGVSIYDRDTQRFNFHKGPVFAQLVLADEVNRATPKAQSALLEAMEEHQVTADGATYPLPKPFFVIATQNPTSQIGTFQLPESQLDRFLMRIELGYPAPAFERELLQGRDRRELLPNLDAALPVGQLLALQDAVSWIRTSDALLDYVQQIVAFTRATTRFATGLSPRAAIAIVRAAQSWALIHGRPGVLPEDVQTILPAVVGHRLRARDEASGEASSAAVRFVIESVPIP